MSLPPGFLDELRSRTSMSQVAGRKVIWDSRKSNQGKGDMWAPCPFHQEKTASFHVDDRKGYYYCFGCHAKGDAISFVRETENVGFMEAVEILARETGMPMPERDPQAQARSEKRNALSDVMEAALQHYRMMLKTAAGAEARDYLAGRGLDEAIQDKFEIGFAPAGWQGLWDQLTGKGIEGEKLLAAGLSRSSDKGREPYDVFRNRIMFPIRDARGRCIAFGGRAMDPGDNAKYLNSPETELFDKGRSLYNLGPAREAVGKGAPLIVAEGYMDVIALDQAGFHGAVAPLGTAITEEQLHLLWRVSPEPLIALDGDTAGLRAAMRLIDLALPLLEAGKSLRFAIMPAGQDPDDLIRAEGPGAVQKVLDNAMPMVRLLWQRETEGQSYDSPERRAALDKALRERVKVIKDQSLRRHYGDALNEMRRELFRPARKPFENRPFDRKRYKGPFGAPMAPVSPAAKNSALAAAGDGVTEHLREAVVLATLIKWPDLIESFETSLMDMRCADPLHAGLRDLLLHASPGADMDKAAEAKLGPDALDGLMRHPHVAISPALRRAGDVEIARMTVTEELAKLVAEHGLTNEVSEAMRDMEDLADEAVTHRLGDAAETRNRAVRSAQEDKAEYDLADNGARIKRDERAALDALLDQIDYAKRRR